MDENQTLKKGFFKKVYYSIFKLEKYGELSAEGVGRALGYLFKISLIVALTISICTLFKINSFKQKGIDFLNEQVGEYTYSNGILKVEKEEPIRAPSSTFGEIIVDTKVQTEEDVNKYINSLEEKKGILVLRDRILVKGVLGDGTVNYIYENTLKDLNVKELNKQQTIDFLNGPEMWKIFAVAFAIVMVYATTVVLFPIVFNAIILCIFGYVVSFIARAKLRFAAIFNLAVYALTLSILLNTIYIIINMTTGFTIKYFQVMYIGVAVIYIIAAIFILKSEFIKIQQEVSKIVKISKQDDKQSEEDKEKEENEENQENKEKQENEKNQENKEKQENKENEKKQENQDDNTKDEPVDDNEKDNNKNPEPEG